MTNALLRNYNLHEQVVIGNDYMDMGQIFQALLAFIFVLGLMFITLWLIKFCQTKGLNCRIGKCFGNDNRIKILERHRLDSKNSLALIEYDQEEFLLLLGSSSNQLLRQNRKGPSAHD